MVHEFSLLTGDMFSFTIGRLNSMKFLGSRTILVDGFENGEMEVFSSQNTRNDSDYFILPRVR